MCNNSSSRIKLIRIEIKIKMGAQLEVYSTDTAESSSTKNLKFLNDTAE